MDPVLELAQKLGEAMHNDTRYASLREAEKKLAADADSKKLLQDFQEQSRKIMECEQKQSPIEPEDKRRMADLHQKVASNPLIKELMKARVEYASLMAGVNKAVFGAEAE